MYDPSMRVLTVLELLQAKERVGAGELAARLEVSVRSVQRYVARLQDLGVPVDSTRGRGAQYRLRPGFRMPPIMFGPEEAFAVALGLNALQHIGLNALAPAVVGVESKLERVLPADLWARTKAVSGALQLEKTAWVEPVDAQTVATLATAVQEGLEVHLEYASHAQVHSARAVRPLGLVREGGLWYLAAYCLLRADERLFRVDRIRGARATQTTFMRPKGFDVRAFAQTRLHATPTRWRCEVWLETTLETVPFDRLPARATLESEGDGLRLRCGANDLEGFAAQLLTLGCRVEVRDPPELHAAFRTLAARAATIAGPSSASTRRARTARTG